MRYETRTRPNRPTTYPPPQGRAGQWRARYRKVQPSLRPTLQDPTTCQAPPPPHRPRSTTGPPTTRAGKRSVLVSRHERDGAN
jgi:hypothetical protein